MGERIKDIYNCSPLTGSDVLVIWYNHLIEKTVEEMTIADVTRCIRQNIFIEKAYEVLLAYLLYNPYAGDVYEGELMDKASEVGVELVLKHKPTIIEIIGKAKMLVNEHEWICEEDKEDYIEAVNRLYRFVSEGENPASR